MKLPAQIGSRVLDVCDGAFEAGAALWRVLHRGAFASDATSVKGARFAEIAADKVLVQSIVVNAADRAEAKKAVALDSERFIPLDGDALVYDIVGPVGESGLRPRPERTYVIGAVRKDALAAARQTLPAMRRGGVEAFVHRPPAMGKMAFVFEDAIGRARRRRRRAILALALMAFALAASDALRALDAKLEAELASLDARRVGVERQIRVAERRSQSAAAAQALLNTQAAPTLRVATARLARVGAHQPLDAETTSINLAGPTLALEGRSYNAEATELAFRRAFDGEELSFEANDGEAPTTFRARFEVRNRGS